MSVLQTTIELKDVWVFKCHKCYKLPALGYDKTVRGNERFLIGCPGCKTEILKAGTIEKAVHKWNCYTVENDDDVADMEGLNWEPDPCNLEEGETNDKQ